MRPLRATPATSTWPRAFGLAFGLWALVAWLTDLDPPTAGEPLGWRWLRGLAEHPLRGVLGLGLLLGPAWRRELPIAPKEAFEGKAGAP